MWYSPVGPGPVNLGFPNSEGHRETRPGSTPGEGHASRAEEPESKVGAEMGVGSGPRPGQRNRSVASWEPC